jgi:hypothetical protein
VRFDNKILFWGKNMKKNWVIGLGIALAMFLGTGNLYAFGCGGMGHGDGMKHDGDAMGDKSGMEVEDNMGAHAGHQHGGQQQGKSIGKVQARQLLEENLKLRANPDLKLGEIMEGEDYFEAEVVTAKDGAIVDKIRLNKNTGSVESVYQGKSRVSETPEKDKGDRH